MNNNWHASSDGKACVSNTLKWQKIDRDAPRHLKTWLINENTRQPFIGTIENNHGATHYCPMPHF